MTNAGGLVRHISVWSQYPKSPIYDTIKKVA
jgi:hypothetical protein